jgi:hypothetical protein
MKSRASWSAPISGPTMSTSRWPTSATLSKTKSKTVQHVRSGSEGGRPCSPQQRLRWPRRQVCVRGVPLQQGRAAQDHWRRQHAAGVRAAPPSPPSPSTQTTIANARTRLPAHAHLAECLCARSNWQGWTPPTAHKAMSYTGGQKCWNGPDRSTEVRARASPTHGPLSHTRD